MASKSKSNGIHYDAKKGLWVSSEFQEKRDGFIKTFYDSIFPFLLIVFAPMVLLVLWGTCSLFDGSLFAAVNHLVTERDLFTSKWWPSPNWTAASIILIFCFVQLVLLVALPGRWWKGTITPAGQQPWYKLNGPASYWISIALFFICSYGLKLFNPSIVYDNFGSILVTLNYSSLVICVILYFKGLYFPSSNDAGSTGNFIRDFFWGTELHPSIGPFNIKQYINCRVGMTGWILINIAFACKQYELYGQVSNSMIVSNIIYIVYIAKFFLWEHGYFNSIDIMHDRFGFYIFWGIMNWVPGDFVAISWRPNLLGLYTTVCMYLATHPIELSNAYAASILAMGAFCVWLNYNADEQRLRFRESKGDCKIWGKKPEYITARYKTADGKEHESLLLVSGWWGVSRHFNYIPEMALSFFWALPSGFNALISWVYFIYICGLLIHRLKRDEERCERKYGADWLKYKERVPYFLIPFLF